MTASMPFHVTSGIKLEIRLEVRIELYLSTILLFFVAEEILDEASIFRETIANITADIERDLDDVRSSVTFIVTLHASLSFRFLMRTVLLVIYAVGQVTSRTALINMIPHG